MSGRTSPSSTPTTSRASSRGGAPERGGSAERLPRGLVVLAVACAAAVILLYLLVVRTYWGQRLDEHAFVGHDFFASVTKPVAFTIEKRAGLL